MKILITLVIVGLGLGANPTTSEFSTTASALKQAGAFLK
jgi:hypothetical protein